MYKVKLTSVIEKMELKNLTPDVDIEDIEVTQTDVNRPALQLAGYYDFGGIRLEDMVFLDETGNARCLTQIEDFLIL